MNWILMDSKPAEVSSSRKRAVPAFNQTCKDCSHGPGGKSPERPEEGAEQAASRASGEAHPPERAWLPRTCWIINKQRNRGGGRRLAGETI